MGNPPSKHSISTSDEEHITYDLYFKDEGNPPSRNEKYIPSDEKHITRNEKFIPESGKPLPLSLLVQTGVSTCKITDDEGGTGSGFFAYIKVHNIEKYGLFTNNHVLGDDQIKPGARISTSLYDDTPMVINITKNQFTFTCELLDVTFVELPMETKQVLQKLNISYLKPKVQHDLYDKIFITQYPGGRELSYAEGNIESHVGFKIKHSASTEDGSSGSPVLSIDGFVIGVHHGCDIWNSATKFENIFLAIKKTMQKKKQKMQNKLTNSELLELGVNKTANKNVFTNQKQTLWFYRTDHSWFLTENKPVDITKLEYLQCCDWEEVDPDKVFYFNVDADLYDLNEHLINHLATR